MTVDITWAKDKRDITTHNTQTKHSIQKNKLLNGLEETQNTLYQ